MSSAITCINLEEMTELLHLIYIYIYKENKFNKSCEHILYTRIYKKYSLWPFPALRSETFRFEEIDRTRTRLPNFFVQKKRKGRVDDKFPLYRSTPFTTEQINWKAEMQRFGASKLPHRGGWRWSADKRGTSKASGAPPFKSLMLVARK